MITNDGGWGYGPRSIMAQKKDGSIMFFVIDGRQTHSIGASLRDCQDILYEKVLSMRWQWTVHHQQHYMQWEIF